MNRLLTFCKQFNSIVCYGSSEHGFIVKHYLENHGIQVSAFLTSSILEEIHFLDGVPVYTVKDVKDIPVDCGIVLSLYERHHLEVLRNLEVNGSFHKVYPISDIMQQKMHRELILATREKILMQPVELTENEKLGYEARCQELLRHYQKVECRFISVFRLGGFVIWRYYCYLKKKHLDEIFYLYYPVAHEHHSSEKLRGANGYLLTKLKAPGLESLNENNLRFWQYMFQKNQDRCVMSDDYTINNWTERYINDFALVPADENLIVFNDVEEQEGRRALKEMHVVSDYVCMANRDMAFHRKVERNPLTPDFRDVYRNSDIENYVLAADFLADQGLQAVRMGSVVERPWRHSNVIDYSSSGMRSEFLDAFLVSKCKFFISDAVGIQAFAMLMAKPMVTTNATLLTCRYDAPPIFSSTRDITILKKLWDQKNGRYLTIREMLDYEVNICVQESNIMGAVYSEYKKRDIIPIDNTEEEILAVVREMNERLDGTVQYDALDIELQARYRDIVDNFPMSNNLLNNWRLGAAFLRENQWLLE